MPVPHCLESDAAAAEARHRLANCFQMILYLGRTRLERIDDGEARRQLIWLLGVVDALAMLEQKLVTAGGAGLGSFLKSAALLWRRMGADKGIRIEVETAAIEPPRGATAALALIANELVTNCIKHAFYGRPSGLVTVQLSRVGDASGELCVCDDGRGLAQDSLLLTNANGGGCLGLSLVHTFSTGFGGSFVIGRRQPCGTRAQVRFPL